MKLWRGRMKVRTIRWRVLMVGLLAISSLRAEDVNLYTYFAQGGFCAFDEARYYLSPSVGADAVPGDYGFGVADPHNTGEVVVTVHNDPNRTWTMSPADGSWYDPHYSTLGNISVFSRSDNNPSGHPIMSQVVNLIVQNLYFSEDCLVVENFGQSRNILFHVQIGSASYPPLPPDGNQTKECDANTGCQKCSLPGTATGTSASSGAMAAYWIHLMLASLHIEDTPISYNCPVGPSPEFKIVYNQREATQPAYHTNNSNFGPKWTFNWLSYVTDDPNNLSGDTSVYVRGGGTEVYSGYNSTTHSYAPDMQSLAVLVRITSDPIRYEKQFPDGSKEVFSVSDQSLSSPRRIFLSSVVDPAGNAVSLTYDSTFRITAIADSVGNPPTTLAYQPSGDPFKITSVTDPFGRSAQFQYNGYGGQLSTIIDPVGIQSQFFYQQDDTNFINHMQTPYGDTYFTTGANGDSSRWIQVTDPEGGMERVEYNNFVNGIPPSETVAPDGVQNVGLNTANTFYWDKKAMEQSPGDYSKARITHWLTSADGTKLSGIKHSEKRALENRVWYNYVDQAFGGSVGRNALPARIARILDDGATLQASHFEYNLLGTPIKMTDPAGRVTSYEYAANDIDVTAIYQELNPRGTSTDPYGAPADKIAGYIYNSLHEPLTATDAAQQPTTYTYRSNGQVQSVQNARGETTSYAYGPMTGVPANYLASITSPQFGGTPAVTSFTYDTKNRVHTVTNSPDNYTVTTDYDDLDRPLRITYPDTTNQQFQYLQDFGHGQGPQTILDLTQSTDRRGLTTTRHYNGNRQMDSITDPLTRQTQYGWCTCGALTSITDANHHVTTFTRDLLSRVIIKTFDGGTYPVHYTYENTTSRLKSMTDAQGQVTNYSYFVDNDLQQVSYTSVINTTPNVSYAYDTNYNRVVTMSDGTGQTNYSYYPVTGGPSLGADQLSQVDGPLGNYTISYAYDELGRAVSQNINGTIATVSYDSLGRLSTTTNVLGPFTRIYDSVTPRLLTLNDPNGQTSNYIYYDNSHDRRLQTLHSTVGQGNVNLSRHDYTYDPEGQILTWNKTLGTQPETDQVLSYDNADQLTGVAPPPPQQGLRKQYDYDNAGNRLTDLFFIQFLHGGNTYTVNNLNQLDTVVIDPGNAPATGPFSLTYDGNGNLMADQASNRTFEWDAANRLVAINYNDTHDRTQFTYDGLGRRVQITEYGPAVMAVVQPKNGSYAAFKTASFTLLTGAYEVTFTGVNPNAGNNTAFIDQVALNGTLVANGGFETPQVNDYAIAPAQSGWSYTGNAGIAANGGTFIGTNPAPPEGNQAAFVTNNGSLTQIGSVAPGTYALSFKAAQRASSNQSYQQVQVSVRGALSTKTFVWSGNTIAEERDASGSNVTKRFFAEGEQRIGGSDAGNYYYTRDHLGSIREVTDSTGALQAQYDYDAWGKPVVLSGNMSVDFGYTGHYFHQPSGLNLSMYRAYNPSLGRWISRDPIEEAGGVNLYRYVGNNVLNSTDRLGLCPGDWWDPRTWFNEGLTDSLLATWISLQDTTGDFLTGQWDRLAADAASNPLGQTENSPTGYTIEWTLLAGSTASASTALGAGAVEWWSTLPPGAKFAIINTIMKAATGEGDRVEPPFRAPPKPPPFIGGP